MLLMILQAWQKSLMTTVCSVGLVSRSVAIWFMMVCISGAFSIGMVVPLTFLEYLLTADWVIPRTSATCVSFISCFSRSVFARRALIAGATVLTATSHGVSNLSPVMLFYWENLYKDAVCHVLYDACPDGSPLKTEFSADLSHLLPVRHTSPHGEGNPV